MDPDEELTAARCRQLNERFYSANPAAYFRTRLLTLLALAGNPVGVVGLLREGVEYGGVRVKSDDSVVVDLEELRRYVTIESQVLQHHSAEALVRLFLAHADRPPCPWIVLSGEKSFGRFKERVKRLVVDQPSSALDDPVGRVFFGGPSRGDEDETWSRAVQHTASFVRVLAERWLRDAHLYNAIKHGLATAAGDAVLEMLPDDGDPVAIGAGSSIDYLEVGSWENDRRQWRLSTDWVDVTESLGLVQVATQMSESLWLIARHRYVGGPAEGPIFFPADLEPSALRTRDRAPARTMSWALIEEHRVVTS